MFIVRVHWHQNVKTGLSVCKPQSTLKTAWPSNPRYAVGGSHVGPFNMSAAE